MKCWLCFTTNLFVNAWTCCCWYARWLLRWLTICSSWRLTQTWWNLVFIANLYIEWWHYMSSNFLKLVVRNVCCKSLLNQRKMVVIVVIFCNGYHPKWLTARYMTRWPSMVSSIQTEFSSFSKFYKFSFVWFNWISHGSNEFHVELSFLYWVEKIPKL